MDKQDILNKMMNQTGGSETEEKLTPVEDSNDEGLFLKEITRKDLKVLMDEITSTKIVLNFNGVYFELNYSNIGQQRISAKLLNPVKD